MDERIKALITETIEVENKVAALYRLFAHIFPEDESFWFGLSEEEECHADIITSGRDFLMEAGMFPLAALDPSIESIKKTSEAISATILLYEHESPTRSHALARAIEIELSSSELFYQFALDLPFKSAALDLLREMTGENKNHILKLLGQIKSVNF